jgi:hypothetical protein
MPRTHGYAQKGKRCFAPHDWGAKGRTNLIGALVAGVLLTVSLFTSSFINTCIRSIRNSVAFSQLILG